MLPPAARLLRLLSLLQGRRSWPGSVLAQRLGITERTVRRDIDRLRQMGYRIHATPGPDGGYQIDAGSTLPPLLFEQDEALAVSLALRIAAAGAIRGIEQPALAALLKLERLMPARWSRKAQALASAVQTLSPNTPAVDAELLATLASTCAEHQVLCLNYTDAQGRTSVRRVEPHGLVHAAARWYLVAWDLGRNDWRSFRADRMASADVEGASFEPRPLPDAGDLAAFVQRSASVFPYEVRARVLLHAPRADMAERIPPLAAQLSDAEDGRCLLQTGANDLSTLACWLCSLDVDFDVLEPPDLQAFLRRLHRRLGRAARKTTA